MFREDTIKELIELVGIDTTQYLITIRAINSTTKVKPEDLTISGNFAKRVIKKVSRIIPVSNDKLSAMLMFVCDLSTRDSLTGLNGLGGYTEKPISYYLEKHGINKNL